MKISEALETVNRIYIPGLAKHFESKNPNEWQSAHDKFGSVIALLDSSMTELAAQRFVNACSALVDEFKSMRIPLETISNSDAFHIGDVGRHARIQSVKYKMCAYCGVSKQTLKIVSVGPVEVELVCAECIKNPNKKYIGEIDKNEKLY